MAGIFENSAISKQEIIKCPKCGREYLPAEVYYPKDFFGNPQDILRNNQGEIEDCLGSSLNTTEHYTCDSCNTCFKVTAKVSFKTVEVPKYGVSKPYRTQLFGSRIVLDEDSISLDIDVDNVDG